jgi:hypothetical protein
MQATMPGRALIFSAPAFWALLRQQPSLREHVVRYLARQVGHGRDALAARCLASGRLSTMNGRAIPMEQGQRDDDEAQP